MNLVQRGRWLLGLVSSWDPASGYIKVILLEVGVYVRNENILCFVNKTHKVVGASLLLLLLVGLELLSEVDDLI